MDTVFNNKKVLLQDAYDYAYHYRSVPAGSSGTLILYINRYPLL